MAGGSMLAAGSQAAAASRPSLAGTIVVEGQLTGAPSLGGVRVALYAMPPQPFMKRLRAGERFQSKLVGTATSTMSGAYAISVSDPAAITSSVFYGHVNLMIEAAGHGYVSLYGLPRQVSTVSGRTMLGSLFAKATASPARATLIMHRISPRDAAAISDTAATSGCWLLSTDDGPVVGKIDGVFGEINGVQKTVSYTSGSTSSDSIAIDVNNGGWVTGQAGNTSVTGGGGSEFFPIESGWTDKTFETEFEEGTFQTCQISSEISTFPYAWDGGTLAAAVSPPAAHFCVRQLSRSTLQQYATQAFTYSSGVDLSQLFGIQLSSTTGWSHTTTLSYYYRQNGYACGVKNYPGRTDVAPKSVVADATSSGNNS